MIGFFSPWDPGDAAIESSRWVAENSARLLTEAGKSVVLLARDRGSRADLETLIQHPQLEGLGHWGHGSTDAAFGLDGDPVLTAADAPSLRGRWAYFFACNTGYGLVAQLANAGVRRVVGYRISLRVAWQPRRLAAFPEVAEAAAQALTSVVLALATDPEADLGTTADNAERDFIRFWRRYKKRQPWRTLSETRQVDLQRQFDRVADLLGQLTRNLVALP